MVVTGKQVIKLIKELLNASRQSLSAAAERAQQGQIAQEQIMLTEQELLQELSQLYTKKSQSNDLKVHTDLIAHINESIASQAQIRAQSQERLHSMRQIIQELETKEKEVKESLELIKSDIKAREENLKDIIPRFATLVHERGLLERKLIKLEERADFLHKEATEKLPVYNQEPVFSFLLQIGYKTKNYSGLFPFTLIHNWLAKKVDFKEQQKDYLFLLDTPSLLEQEIENRREALQKLLSEEMQIASDTEEGRKLLTQTETHEVRYLELLEIREKIESTRLEIEKETIPKEDLNRTIFTGIRDFLIQQTDEQLSLYSKSTETTIDDDIVSKVVEVRNTIERENQKIAYAHENMTKLQNVIAVLKEILNQATKQGYGTDLSLFNITKDERERLFNQETSSDEIALIWKNIQKTWRQKLPSSSAHTELTRKLLTSIGESVVRGATQALTQELLGRRTGQRSTTHTRPHTSHRQGGFSTTDIF